ncbi:MAG: hypothetical protein MUC43_15065 [Pirellula sp.]|nr:hypothetical protein [Pirellula sp.]
MTRDREVLVEQTKQQARAICVQLASAVASGDVGIDLELGGRNYGPLIDLHKKFSE